MRSFSPNVSGQRPLDSRSVQQPPCSCSYPAQPSRYSRRSQAQRQLAEGEAVGGRRPSIACGAWAAATTRAPEGLPVPRRSSRNDNWRCAASSGSPPESEEDISGYTPANYITFTEDPSGIAEHAVSITVNAPISQCFGIWNDWNRLVEFLDLVAQIGLDPNNHDLALFQCFYRHGHLPTMEIVFVLQRTESVQDQRIAFESVWGMPMSGEITFTEKPPAVTAAGQQPQQPPQPKKQQQQQHRRAKSSQHAQTSAQSQPAHPQPRTEITLRFRHALPDILLGLGAGPADVQGVLGPILKDNLRAFRRIAEAEARDPARAAAAAAAGREEAEARGPGALHYPLFDEQADAMLFGLLAEGVEEYLPHLSAGRGMEGGEAGQRQAQQQAAESDEATTAAAGGPAAATAVAAAEQSAAAGRQASSSPSSPSSSGGSGGAATEGTAAAGSRPRSATAGDAAEASGKGRAATAAAAAAVPAAAATAAPAPTTEAAPAAAKKRSAKSTRGRGGAS